MGVFREVLMVPAVACLMLELAPRTAAAQGCTAVANATLGPCYQVWGQTYTLGACASGRVEVRVWMHLWDNIVPCVSGSTLGA
jgi:hypothetical protein